MNRYTLFALLPLTLLVGCSWVKEKDSAPVVGTTTREIEFKQTESQIASDLVDKGVTVGPFAQLWVFAENQNIRLKILQKKAVDDTVVVAVTVEAVAVTPKDESPKAPIPATESGVSQPQTPGKAGPVPSAPPKTDARSNPPLPSSIRLTGVMKVVYEEIGGQWCIVGIGDVKLKLVPQK